MPYYNILFYYLTSYFYRNFIFLRGEMKILEHVEGVKWGNESLVWEISGWIGG